jgi:hypothetical protein
MLFFVVLFSIEGAQHSIISLLAVDSPMEGRSAPVAQSPFEP